LLEEQPTLDCVEKNDELVLPNMPKFENVIAKDIAIDVKECSTPISEPKPKPTSFVQP